MQDRPGELAAHLARLTECVVALDRLIALAGEIPEAVEATARAMAAKDFAGVEAGKARLEEIGAAVRALAAPAPLAGVSE